MACPYRLFAHAEEPGTASGADVAWAADPGVELARGSLDDAHDLSLAMTGVDVLLMVLDQTDAGPDGRLRRGVAAGDAARQAGVRHVVFVAAAPADHQLIYCDLGDEVGTHLRALGLPLTVLRPATYLEEIPWYWLNHFGPDLTLSAPFPPAMRLPVICVDDVGGLAALAARSPDLFTRTGELAGDAVSMEEVADLLTEEVHHEVRATEIQVEGTFVFAKPHEPPVDLAWLRRLYPRLHTARGWLASAGGLEECARALGLEVAASGR